MYITIILAKQDDMKGQQNRDANVKNAMNNGNFSHNKKINKQYI